MRKFTSSVFNTLLIFLIAFLFINIQTTAQNYEKYYQDCKLYVKFKDSYQPDIRVAADKTVALSDAEYFSPVIKAYDVKSISRPFDYKNDPKLIRTFEMTLANHNDLEAAIADLEKMAEVEYAEKVPMQYIDFRPNDPLYNLISGLSNWNWHLDVIHAEEAWDITHGDPEIKVAIVDNAIWADHPDLADKIVLQYDAYYNTNSSNPPDSGNPAEWSHGTHCAGLATAITNNNIGVAGIGYNTSIIAVKVSKNDEPQYVHKAKEGMAWAMNNGANVISMSYGGTSFSQTEQNLINSGTADGIVFVAAAGNENISTPHYPSCYDNVISVASTDENDSKSNFSNFNDLVDVSAPGGSGSAGPAGLLSSTWDSTYYGYYDYYSGTSMACPMVAGLCTLILSLNPDLTPDEVEEILKSSCDNIDAQNPDYIGMLGAGRINAYQTVLAVPYEPVPEFMVELPLILPASEIQFEDMTLGIPTSWNWTFEGGTPASSTEQSPMVTFNTAGVFDVTLVVSNDFGTITLTKEDFITVTATPAPYIDFEVDNTMGCVMVPMSFTDLSLYEPTAWLWEFEPNTIEFIEGTNATSQNPVVQFNDPGIYSFSFTATNANGSATGTFEDYFDIAGMLLPFETGFENGASDFALLANENANIMIDNRAANGGDYGLHFTGVGNLQGWAGGPFNTSPEQAWEENEAFHSVANVCNINATAYAGIYLILDMKQTYSLGPTLSWFRVLVNNETQIPDVDGNLNFNPATNADPFVERKFNLGPWAGDFFSLQLQASCRLYDKFFAEGDNVFVDNVQILGSMVGVDELFEVPFDIVSVYPNPANETMTVKFTTNTPSEIVVSLTSVTGQKVYESIQTATSGTTMIPVAVGNLSQGIYVVNVQSENGITTQKIVVE